MDEQFKKDLGHRIYTLRQDRKISQRELGERLKAIDPDLYVGQATVSSWEKGRTEPSMGHVKAMARIFNCTISDIVSANSAPKGSLKSYMISVSEKEYLIIETLRKDQKKFDAIYSLISIE